MTQQGDETIDARLALFEKQKAAVEKQIEELHRTLDIINYKYWYYTVAKEKGSTAAVENIPDDEMTPELIETRYYLHRSLL